MSSVLRPNADGIRKWNKAACRHQPALASSSGRVWASLAEMGVHLSRLELPIPQGQLSFQLPQSASRSSREMTSPTVLRKEAHD